ncbi:MAG: type I restriction enzyme HsdR N-terminal domain-containing protein [Chlamydiae bacterium]|nr:type I restriction enzyme HsdR N-terminal domain-containing protein [Chlamydiota bacterium]
MPLSKRNNLVFDLIRKEYVPATKEEIIRQKLLLFLIDKLGFPKELIAVEKELGQLPHVKEKFLPERRADVICFAKGIHPEYPLYPLLLIECKQNLISEDAIQQVLGYNHFVKAHFVGVAGEKECRLIYPTKLPFIPSYSELIARC